MKCPGPYRRGTSCGSFRRTADASDAAEGVFGALNVARYEASDATELTLMPRSVRSCQAWMRPAWTGPLSRRGRLGYELPAASYDCVMTEPDAVAGLPSPSSALLQLARLKAGMSQRELAERAGVPVTMISAYERDQRQPTLATLLRLLRAAGFDLRLHLAAYDPHDEILAGLEAGRSETERDHRDRQLQAWRDAVPVDGAA